MRLKLHLPQDLPRPLITRFAPSPTGFLHMGHVLSMMYVWGIARYLNAQIILRIEDHDRGRCRKEYEEALFDDLKRLGLGAAMGPKSSTEASPYRQSDCLNDYEEALDFLAQNQLVYSCTCSRKEIAAQSDSPANEELRYHNHCRLLNLPYSKASGIRLALPDQPVDFTDLYLGPQRQIPSAQCGDLLLKDRSGNYTYHFANVVDDIRQGVNLVVRGQDLTASTGRQIMLSQMLGRKKPSLYLHHPLALDPSGQKLSKRSFADGIEKRFKSGTSAMTLWGEAAFLGGFIPSPQDLSLEDCLEVFTKSITRTSQIS